MSISEQVITDAYPALTATLRQLVHRGRIHHVTVFHAPTISDVRLFSSFLARLLLCIRPDGDYCLPDTYCTSCAAVISNRHPDVFQLDPLVDASTLSVDQIREARARLRLIPEIGSVRILVIPDLNACTPAASNALLKTLEEPPSTAMVIGGTSNLSQLSPTIQSRLHVLTVPPLHTRQSECVLQSAGITLPDASIRIQAAAGSLTRLLEFSQTPSSAWDTYHDWSEWWNQFFQGNSNHRAQLVNDRFGTKGIDRTHVHQALLYGLQYASSPTVEPTTTQRLERLSALYEALNANVAPSLILDGCILHL